MKASGVKAKRTGMVSIYVALFSYLLTTSLGKHTWVDGSYYDGIWLDG